MTSSPIAKFFELPEGEPENVDVEGEDKEPENDNSNRKDTIAAESLIRALENGQSRELSPEEALEKYYEFAQNGARVIKLCSNCAKLEDRSVRKYPRCGSCKTVYYCDAKCQRLDWPRHKPFCLKGGEGYFETGEHCSSGGDTMGFNMQW